MATTERGTGGKFTKKAVVTNVGDNGDVTTESHSGACVSTKHRVSPERGDDQVDSDDVFIFAASIWLGKFSKTQAEIEDTLKVYLRDPKNVTRGQLLRAVVYYASNIGGNFSYNDPWIFCGVFSKDTGYEVFAYTETRIGCEFFKMSMDKFDTPEEVSDQVECVHYFTFRTSGIMDKCRAFFRSHHYSENKKAVEAAKDRVQQEASEKLGSIRC
jgi:hypothetical protein